MNYDLVVINGDSFSEGNGLYRQFDTYKEECKYYDYWLDLKTHSKSEVFLDRAFSWGLKIAEILNVPLLNIAKSGSSNKSILRRWYYLMGIAPHNNPDKINEFKLGEENWFFLNPNKKDFIEFNHSSFRKFKNPLCITQWSNSYRADMVYRSNTYSLNPGQFVELEKVTEFIENTQIPLSPEKFHIFYQYFSNLVNGAYLTHYENVNNLFAFKGLMDSNGVDSYSIPNRLADILEFGYEKVIGNVLPFEETKKIEENTFTLKDVGIDNLHFSLEGHEYYGEQILNLINNDR